MKILLIQPAKAHSTIGGEDVYMFEPLALEYVAAGVVNDHEVKILDMRVDKNLKKFLTDYKPDIVGITAYTVHVNTVKQLFKEIKDWNPEVFTVVGGHHATVSPDDFLDSSIDLIIMGDGIFTFREVVRWLENQKEFDGIEGIAYKKEGKAVKASYKSEIDLDSFPFPKRDLTEKYRSQYFTEWMKPLASIRISKGCPFRCSFCALWKLTGGKYLTRSPENIIKELLGIKEEFVFFADDESLVDVERMMELARLIKEYGIKKRYFLYGRSDTIVKHPKLLEAWKEIGLERIFVGLEFFRNEDLRYINKGSTTRDNEDATKILQNLDIDIYASFIIRPEFTKEDFREFRRYCRRSGFNFATFSVLTPLPGTDFYEEVKDQLITYNYDYVDFLHTLLPTTLPLKDFYKELFYLYKKAVPLNKGISFVRKFPLREIPSLLKRTNRILDQLKNAYKDYDIYV